MCHHPRHPCRRHRPLVIGIGPSAEHRRGDNLIGREVIDERQRRHVARHRPQHRFRPRRRHQHMVARGGGGQRHRRDGQQHPQSRILRPHQVKRRRQMPADIGKILIEEPVPRRIERPRHCPRTDRIFKARPVLPAFGQSEGEDKMPRVPQAGRKRLQRDVPGCAHFCRAGKAVGLDRRAERVVKAPGLFPDHFRHRLAREGPLHPLQQHPGGVDVARSRRKHPEIEGFRVLGAQPSRGRFMVGPEIAAPEQLAPDVLGKAGPEGDDLLGRMDQNLGPPQPRHPVRPRCHGGGPEGGLRQIFVRMHRAPGVLSGDPTPCPPMQRESD